MDAPAQGQELLISLCYVCRHTHPLVDVQAVLCTCMVLCISAQTLFSSEGLLFFIILPITHARVVSAFFNLALCFISALGWLSSVCVLTVLTYFDLPVSTRVSSLGICFHFCPVFDPLDFAFYGTLFVCHLQVSSFPLLPQYPPFLSPSFPTPLLTLRAVPS